MHWPCAKSNFSKLDELTLFHTWLNEGLNIELDLSLIQQTSNHTSRVSCQKDPTRHAYAWQIGPFWQDIIDLHFLPIPRRHGSLGFSKDQLISPTFQWMKICSCSCSLVYSTMVMVHMITKLGHSHTENGQFSDHCTHLCLPERCLIRNVPLKTLIQFDIHCIQKVLKITEIVESHKKLSEFSDGKTKHL